MAGLERCDDAVGGQGHRAERDERHALVLFDADPDEVGAADLGDGGGDEQRDGPGGHAAIVPAGPTVLPSVRARDTMTQATAAAATCRTATVPASTARPVLFSSS